MNPRTPSSGFRESGDSTAYLDRSIRDLLTEIEETQNQLALLRQENAWLRESLGMQSPRGTTIEPAPTSTPPRPASSPDLASHSQMQEKVGVLRSLFRGRDDVYAVRWTSRTSGKNGYSPAARGGWGAAKVEPRSYLPLTDKVVEDHVRGIANLGIYPLLPDDTCWFLACDFDGEGWPLDAQAFLAVAKTRGVPASLERSRSGSGGHVWIFFSSPVAAAEARRLGTVLLREAMVARAEIDLASYDRLFPGQDFLPKGGLGNLIALPLQGRCCESGNTVFLDTSTMDPWPDQWDFLAHVTRASPAQVERTVASIPPVLAGFEAGRASSRHSNVLTPAPPTIACSVGAMLSLERSGLPSWLLAEIKHLASLHNPLFYERQRLRLSTFRTPRFIKCYEEDLARIHLPRGVLSGLTDIVGRAGSKLAVTDARKRLEPCSFAFRGTLTPLQQDAVTKLLADELGVLVAPPGTGKTVMGCAVIAARNLPTLVLVHRQPLLDQWRLQLATLLALPPDQIGQIGGGKRRPTGVIDVAMIQSLKATSDLESFFGAYGLVVIDECHHLPAFSFESAVKRAPNRYFLGMTATPYRRDGLQDIITMQCGPIRHQITDRQADGRSELILQLGVRETSVTLDMSEETPIQQLLGALTHEEDRNAIVCDDVLRALAEGRRCLVLSQRTEHCRVLARSLAEMGKAPFMLDGGATKKARVAMLETIQNRPREEELLVIATGQYLGEGFDCPQLDTLFLAFPVSFKGKLVQYTGRLMRQCEGKTVVQVYDYADTRVPVLKRMFEKRMKTYRALGFLEKESGRA